MNLPPSQLDVLSDAWPRRLTCSPMICQAQPHAQPRCGRPRRQRWQQLALAASPQSGVASSASQLGSVGQASTRSTSAATPPTRRTAAERPQNTGCPPWWRGTGRRAQPVAATALPAGPARQCGHALESECMPSRGIVDRGRFCSAGTCKYLLAPISCVARKSCVATRSGRVTVCLLQGSRLCSAPSRRLPAVRHGDSGKVRVGAWATRPPPRSSVGPAGRWYGGGPRSCTR